MNERKLFCFSPVGTFVIDLFGRSSTWYKFRVGRSGFLNFVFRYLFLHVKIYILLSIKIPTSKKADITQR